MNFQSQLAAMAFNQKQLSAAVESFGKVVDDAKKASLMQKGAAVNLAMDSLFFVLKEVQDNQADIFQAINRLNRRTDFTAQRVGLVLDDVEAL